LARTAIAPVTRGNRVLRVKNHDEWRSRSLQKLS
jgi:hypothetical protein